MEVLIIGIFIAFISSYLTYLFTKKSKKDEIQLEVGLEFKRQFTSMLSELDKTCDKGESFTFDSSTYNLVGKYFEKQRDAIQVFSDYLSKNKRKKLLRVWSEYAHPYEKSFPGEFNIPGFDYFTTDPVQENLNRQKLRIVINKIISYSK